ncbi:MAG: hypothetical protein M3Y54_16765 [Bacteroidota bacterium]|nr:hypothetical protein [Bacteroidota bacterium]
MKMKKASVYLSLMLLLASGYSAANASSLTSSTASAVAAYPRNDFFDAGFADGISFLEYESSMYGGTTTYKEHADAELERALQLEQSADYGSDNYYYWYGYRIAIQQKRGDY